jgi:hypothetical protein
MEGGQALLGGFPTNVVTTSRGFPYHLLPGMSLGADYTLISDQGFREHKWGISDAAVPVLKPRVLPFETPCAMPASGQRDWMHGAR